MIDTNPVNALDEYRLGPLETFSIKTRDRGQMEASLIKPPDFDPQRRYPVWLMTYAGPQAPSLRRAWQGGRTFEQLLAQTGVLAFRCDPRSASGKGAESAWRAYRQLGVEELRDLEDAVAWLRAQPYVDASRIGISGHSFGGFMTAYAMTHSELFAAGIAGAPVTDWHSYDTIYTERYMDTPQENPEGYRRTSVVAAAEQLHGRLLLLHGAIDDNVHFQNTLHLVHALQSADKQFELMVYPESRHGLHGGHYQRLMFDFIRRTMLR
jgi:dipeptidyl aminopeptidase/acylaminoacyl peptidase